MLRVVRINCTGTRMSERVHPVGSSAQGLAHMGGQVWLHAGEVAQWTLVWLGWLWLGEQGMRLGWSVASGVLPVVVWWVARLLSGGRVWALRASAAGMGLLGLLTAWGVWWPGGLSDPSAAQASLWAVAGLWGLWCGGVETRSQSSMFAWGPVTWHPLAAAVLAYLTWRTQGQLPSAPWGLSVVLVGCVVVLTLRDRLVAGHHPVIRGVQAGGLQVLPTAAMGLMMGSVWQSQQWCLSLNVSLPGMVAAHLALMAILLVGVTGLWRWLAPAGDAAMQERAGHMALACLALWPWMTLGDSALHGVLAMLLPSLAWALHVAGQRLPGPRPARWASGGGRGWALLLGPGVLAAVGWLSPWLGPVALQSAFALLGVLSAAQWLHTLGRVRAPLDLRLRSKC